MRARASAFAALFGLALTVAPGEAAPGASERVVLVRPSGDNPVVQDAWNRLAAELRIHDFAVEIVDPGAGENEADPATLSKAARTADALAAMALVQETGKTEVDVWLVDRVSGKTTMRTIAVSRGADASSVLAIRAVDLLRASLREFVDSPPPPDIVDAGTKPAPPAVVALSSEPEPRVRFHADALLLALGERFGVAAGPALGLSFVAGDRLDLGIHVGGPVLGANLHTEQGSASLHEELAWVEARFAALRFAGARGDLVELGVNAALGGCLLSAEGHPNAPLVSKKDHVAAFTGAAGGHALLRLSRRVALGLTLRALATAPRLGVAVSDSAEKTASPAFVGSFGIRVGL